jgi:hypothetical protein
MMSTSLCLKLATTASALVLAGVTAANAASPQVCEDYAHAAIVQVRIAMDHPRCERASGPRWSPEWRVHYDWCLGASYQALGAERDARTNWLRACR